MCNMLFFFYCLLFFFKAVVGSGSLIWNRSESETLIFNISITAGWWDSAQFHGEADHAALPSAEYLPPVYSLPGMYTVHCTLHTLQMALNQCCRAGFWSIQNYLRDLYKIQVLFLIIPQDRQGIYCSIYIYIYKINPSGSNYCWSGERQSANAGHGRGSFLPSLLHPGTSLTGGHT